jgi:hypothetical protein
MCATSTSGRIAVRRTKEMEGAGVRAIGAQSSQMLAGLGHAAIPLKP